MPTPILRWPGGKRRMCSRLLPLLPPHTCYVEAFAGRLALLLAKPRSKCEIENDLNEDLVKLYRCAQWHMDALIAEFEGCLSSRLMLVDDSPFNRQAFAPFPFLAHRTRNQLRKQTGPATTFGELIIQSHPTETASAA